MVLIYTTCKDVEQAKKLGQTLVEKKLAACVNVWPLNTMYFWEGKLTDDTEAALLIKTNEPKIAEVESFILKNHSYSTPFVGSVLVHRLNREYKEWMGTVLA
ncbi:MAG: CutA1 divalent ion tolerance protein [Candidatus Jorgensenbacteria bacterium GW2011_GWA1_48_13]|uniref:CutA1 divalent ion tolerance protein n=1 Tax=Candidatus Jorgensenbacteria bacterium GW2011_GWB1_50_10 TaxID=1618665 RepID=A0A0G1Z7G5_9BACT|nr:MAG: CutA1 divalent ion tolerance protein [Candidatus Jorgensenbacteria bacterium GW2011_GWA1_48_13]KKW14889.1 MAG: CutA1 divalent ion tolerance protein [Candidatus Jorgensenbacteria bacterium GW2011_GWB1_50_10]